MQPFFHVLAVPCVAAGKALFESSTTLLLTQLANTSEYLTFPPNPRSGVLTQVLHIASADLVTSLCGNCMHTISFMMMPFT